MHKMLQRCAYLTLASTLIVAASTLSVSAQEAEVAMGVGPNGVGAAAVADTRAVVIGIDKASNSITLRGAAGHVAEIAVDRQVGDVGKLRIGDVVSIEYRNALLIHADKVKSDGVRERVEETATVPFKDGATASVRRIHVLATIQHIDGKKRQVTLLGPRQTYVVDVSPDVPLKDLKVGDTVSAEFESATAVQITRDGAPLS
jgi:Cu/Ag efflux protein CusF